MRGAGAIARVTVYGAGLLKNLAELRKDNLRASYPTSETRSGRGRPRHTLGP